MPVQSGDLVKKWAAGLVLPMGEPWLGCQLHSDGLSESFAFPVHLQSSRWLGQQVIGKQCGAGKWIYSLK